MSSVCSREQLFAAPRFSHSVLAEKGDFVIKKATEDVCVGRGVGVDVHPEKWCH